MFQQYYLMNRGYRTSLIQIDTQMICSLEKNGIPSVNLVEIYDNERLPFPVQYTDEESRDTELEKWICKRLIPDNRDGINALYSFTGIQDRFLLSMKAYGQNITDGFWFCPVGEKINYEDISYKNNKFSYDVGNMLLGLKKDNPDLNSPDLTTNGWLKKCWRVKNGKFYLLKQGSAPHFEEPYNEVIATKFLSSFCKVPFVKYRLENINGITCSICESFIGENMEFIPAHYLYHTKSRAPFETPDMHLRERCRYFQIPGYKDFLDHMRYIDYVLANTDRHLGNFGFLYDINRLKFIGPAPLFDNGTSLWNCDEMLPDEPEEQIAEHFTQIMERIKHPSHITIPDIDIAEIITDIYKNSEIPEEKIKIVSEHATARLKVSNSILQKEAIKELKKQKNKERSEEER